MTREPIYAAVFAFFQALTVGGSPAFVTATRLAKPWNDVAPEDTPALLQMQVSEEAVYKKGLPTIWKLKVKLMLYVTTQNALTPNPSLAPSQIINPLVDAIVAALVIDDEANNCCTLGGIVSHCAVEGVIEIFEGDIGDEAVVVVPITILTSP